ncbi:MAG: TetR/AcrR family transcriptional regulator [Galbitalea sp.]
MDGEPDVDETIRELIAPFPDVTSAYIASGLHPDFPVEPERGDGTRRLLIAACDAFFEVGYSGASTRDIATAAGMSATAMYAHYESKQAMLLKLCVFGSGSALENLKRVDRPEDPTPQRLRTAVYAFAKWHAVHHVLCRVAQWDIASLEPHNLRIVASLRRETDAFIRSILLAGIESGEFIVADLSGTTLAILSLCIDIVRWFPSRSMHTPESIAATYAALAEAMVVPRHA